MTIENMNLLKDLIIKCAKCDVDVASIDDSTDLIKDLGYNSICVISLIVEVENMFNINFDDEDDPMIFIKFPQLCEAITRRLH